ncbi:DNA poymerase III subunit delta' [hydrothermal vent metagenome]|uniref:DNA poymerase III subunit delta n=1 Tax=hydrothermal vent metagenome TaxID=652676 RepID=A0A1W1EEL6_9ZZZZ
MTLSSQVIVTSNIEDTIVELEKLRTDETIVEIISPNMKEILDPQENLQAPVGIQRVVTETSNFRLPDAKTAIEKAYMTSVERTIIVLAAKSFTADVQNKLLKVIEEPPANKVFILITESKSAILTTIKSRIPIVVLNEEKIEDDLGLDLTQLSLATAYEFIQQHKRTDSKTMKRIVERISSEAIKSDKYDLDEKTLSLFSSSYMALDVGSPGSFVLNTLLLKLLARKKR